MHVPRAWQGGSSGVCAPRVLESRPPFFAPRGIGSVIISPARFNKLSSHWGLHHDLVSFPLYGREKERLCPIDFEHFPRVENRSLILISAVLKGGQRNKRPIRKSKEMSEQSVHIFKCTCSRR
jgi:hypothetical protein